MQGSGSVADGKRKFYDLTVLVDLAFLLGRAQTDRSDLVLVVDVRGDDILGVLQDSVDEVVRNAGKPRVFGLVVERRL